MLELAEIAPVMVMEPEVLPIEEMLPKAAWVKEFLYNLGIEKDGKKYWIYPKKQPQGEYDVVINTRGNNGEQKSISEIAGEAKEKFEL